MSEWTPKRFWTTAEAAETDAGFAVRLDGRVVKTPAKRTLAVPTRALAEEIAAEWQAQGDKVDPATMPATRSANAALDKVVPQHAEVATMISAYGDTDLACYRADYPEGLAERQARAWDPLLDWVAREAGARLTPVSGVMHVPQDPRALARLDAWVRGMDAFALTALHDLVGLSGSLVIGLAATRDVMTPEALWTASRIDETWQEEQWGTDEQAAAQAARKRSDFLHAHRFYNLSRPAGQGDRGPDNLGHDHRFS
ncbi:ATP12 family chaperone protein [Roseovarius salinarum]|uniref:ATP12 family chaperone protein n=1 Tax=Roseovarius salinarum TaxID=1981892 RepID=UPI000C33E354|nr:ATP12 family protein [Roseovarius salinarum]